MKNLLFVAALFMCATTKGQSYALVSEFPRDAHGKITLFEIFNVYNREAGEVMKYAKSYFDKEKSQYKVDSNTVIGKVSYAYKGFNTSCIAKVDILSDVVIHAKDGKTMIEFTNITYKGKSRCGNEGTIEQLEDCDDCGNKTDFRSWLTYKMRLTAREYHKHLKNEVRTHREF